MEILVNSSEMKYCDANTISYFKVPSLVLMERAALGLTAEIKRQVPISKRCLVVCGRGNNGGDGLAAARLLFQLGYPVDVVMAEEVASATPETSRQYQILKAYGLKTLSDIPQRTYGVVVDALFGIGLARNLEGRYLKLIEKMNEIPAFKVAVDIPSGIHADDGRIMGGAFLADVTVTFAFKKAGLLFYPGSSYAGRIVKIAMGIDEHSWLGQKPSLLAYEKEDMSLLPSRFEYSNKGSYGKVLVVAGQKNMAGAAFLSAKAAAVTGCGLVKIFTAEENRIILQNLLPEAILETWEQSSEPEEIKASLKKAVMWADTVIAGPGLGTTEAARKQVACVLSDSTGVVILDADALNLAAMYPELLQNTAATVIVTPHLGEMSRLLGISVSAIQKNPVAVATSFAKEYNMICVLKDARTLCAMPTTTTTYVNLSGNNGMATAGSGDVLTGIIGGLLAQGTNAQTAAPLGVYLHGLAGDEMVKKTGAYGLLAQDIIAGLKQIMRKETGS